jgi:hypothetical protein
LALKDFEFRSGNLNKEFVQNKTKGLWQPHSLTNVLGRDVTVVREVVVIFIEFLQVEMIVYNFSFDALEIHMSNGNTLNMSLLFLKVF